MPLTISCYVDRLLAGPSPHSLLISWLWAWPTMIINMPITAPDTQVFTKFCLGAKHLASYLIPMTILWSRLGNLRLIRGCWWVARVECRLLQVARSAGPETSGGKVEQHPMSAPKVLASLSSPHSLLGLEPWLAPANGGNISSIGQRNGKVFSCLSPLESKVLIEPMVTWWRGSGKKEGSLWSLFTPFGWEVILTNRIYELRAKREKERMKEEKEEIFLAWRMMSWAWGQARSEICISQSVCATQPESFLCQELAWRSENKWSMCVVRPLGAIELSRVWLVVLWKHS